MKKVKYILILIMLLTLTLPAISLAQQGPDPLLFITTQRWWANQRVIDELGLREEQIEELEVIYVEFNKLIIQLKANVETKKFELEYLLEQEEYDMEVIEETVDELLAAREELEKVHIMTRIEMLSILDYEQRVKLMALIEEIIKRKAR